MQQRVDPVPPLRVLVVDDDDDNRESAALWLEVNGCRATACANGYQALERLRAGEQFDVALCDLFMPGMAGGETLRELRMLAPSARLYLVTGAASLVPANAPCRRWIDGLIEKPLHPHTLNALLRAARDDATPDLAGHA